MKENIKINNFKFKTIIQLRYEEFDTFYHLNNIAYLSCCQFGRDIFFRKELPLFDWAKTPFVVASNTLNYYKEILLGINEVEVYVRIVEVGNKSLTIEHLMTSINQKTNEIDINCYNKAILVRLDPNTRQSLIIEDNLRKDFNKLIV